MNTMSDVNGRILVNIGKTIVKLRKIHKFSQEDLAEAADMHRTYLSEIEGGKRNPTILVLKRIVDAFELDMANFFVMVEEKNKNG